MKLNNHGWGMRDMIIYTCILILLLLFVASSIDSLYSQIETSKNEAAEKRQNIETEKKEEDKVNNTTTIEVDYDYYTNLENKVKTATMNYMNDNKYELSNQILNVTLDTLINLGYIGKIYDQTGTEACTAYSNVYEDDNGQYVINSYISCNNYSTGDY